MLVGQGRFVIVHLRSGWDHPAELLTKHMRRSTKVILVTVATVGVGVGWWLGSPLFLDRTVDEAIPVVPTTTIPGAPLPTGDKPDTTKPATSVLIAAGTFAGADDFHQGSGEASVIRLADGSLTLTLADFEVTNGPDLRVTLFDGTDYFDLGALKGNIGNQSYQIPAGTDLEAFESVVIWCRAFDVPFAVASL
jgi:Electron transfer DM13